MTDTMYEQAIPMPVPIPDPISAAASLLTVPFQPPMPPSQGPYCYQCGGATMRNGTCYVCTACGATSGCS